MPRQIHIYIVFFLLAFFFSPKTFAKEIENQNPVEDRIEKNLTAHKALYEIKLLSKRSGAQIVNVSGQMFYEWVRGCDAWETKHRFDLLYEYSDGPPMRITSDFSTFETFDGESLNFSSRRMRDGDLFEEVRGSAKAPPQEQGAAEYTLPQKIKYTLPKGSVFPMGHTMDVLRQIKAGKQIYNATIFDGSDERGPRQASAFIGKAIRPLKSILSNKNINQKLLGSPAHQLRLAYFVLSENEENAEHEMDVIFHENGIISSMVIDYEDFSISQKLVALEAVAPSCGRKSGEMNKIE